jgi:hypothetical protein
MKNVRKIITIYDLDKNTINSHIFLVNLARMCNLCTKIWLFFMACMFDTFGRCTCGITRFSILTITHVLKLLTLHVVQMCFQ